MQKVFYWLMGSLSVLLGTAPVQAFYQGEIDAEVGVGYRQDSFEWTIPGPNHRPDVLSELKWKNLKSFCVSGRLAWDGCYGIYFRGTGNWASVQSGHVTDTDYISSGKRNPFSYSISDAKCSKLYDVSGGVGYRFISQDQRFMVAPLIGYAVDAQNLKIENGETKLFLPNPRLEGDICGLHSHYHARWTGPWVGADLGYDVCWAFLTASVEYHYAHYRGVGHWNLREDFLSDFVQRANGHGLVLSAGLDGYYQQSWRYGLLFQYQHFNSGGGSDEITLDVNGRPYDYKSKFNGARWSSFSITGTLSYTF